MANLRDEIAQTIIDRIEHGATATATAVLDLLHGRAAAIYERAPDALIGLTLLLGCPCANCSRLGVIGGGR